MNEVQQKYARRLADWLGRKTANVPAARMRVYVVLFLIGMAGMNGLALWQGMRNHGKSPVPAAIEIPVTPMDRERSMQPVVDLSRFVDSLRQDPVNGRSFDSLLRTRPGLVDTLRMLGQWR